MLGDRGLRELIERRRGGFGTALLIGGVSMAAAASVAAAPSTGGDGARAPTSADSSGHGGATAASGAAGAGGAAGANTGGAAGNPLSGSDGTAPSLASAYKNIGCDYPADRQLLRCVDAKANVIGVTNVVLQAGDVGKPFVVQLVPSLTAAGTLATDDKAASEGSFELGIQNARKLGITVERSKVSDKGTPCAGDASSCFQARSFIVPRQGSFSASVTVGTNVVKLEFSNADLVSLQQVAQENRCADLQILCLDVHGHPLLGDDLPDPLLPDAHLKTIVIGKSELDAKDFSLKVAGQQSLETLFQRAPTENAAGTDGAPAYVVLATNEFDVPARVSRVKLTFQYNPKGGDAERRDYVFDVERERYFLEVGLALPFVYKGERRLVANSVPGTGERTLGVEQDWSKQVAIMLNFFPFGGRQSDLIWVGNDPKWAASLIGFQIGHSLDIKDPLDRWYAGLVLEPIAGLSLNGGAVLVQGEFVKPNQRLGMLLTPGQSPDADTHAMFRFYAGVTLTLDIVNTISTAITESGKLMKK